MRKFLFISVIAIALIGGIYVYHVNDGFFKATNDDKNIAHEAIKDDLVQNKNKLPDNITGNLFSMMNQTSEQLIATYGEPLRKDKSAYGYTWWIYKLNDATYMQFGVEDNTVQTIYATGNEVSTAPFTIGTDYTSIEQLYPFKDKVTYQSGLSYYHFIIKYDEREVNPLVKIADDLFVQCYFDSFTNKLSSVRIVTGDILTKQRFYEMEYRGSLQADISLSDVDWEEIEKGMERQILDITNMFRARHQVRALIQDMAVEDVAYLHSKDMHDNNYFSHERQDGTGLKERLAEKNITYQAAGENIAAQYSDAPASVEGWLNSEGHREALLHPSYTHLGVGVHRLYYTQNFIKKQ